MPHTIKDNGLPAGTGLYWKDSARSQIWLRVSHNGLVKSYPSGTAEWKKALQVRDKIKAELIKGTRKADVNRAVLIGELLDDYVADLQRKASNRGAYGTGHAYKTESAINKHIRPFFGAIKAAALTTKHLNAYQDKRISEYRTVGKSNGSWVIALNREFAYLRRAFRLGMEATPKKVSSYPRFPIDAKAEKLRARKGIINAEQFRLLMEHAPDHFRPVLPFVTYGGARSKELKFIRREQLDWENRLIHLRDGETKEGPGRDVPIVDVAVEPLKLWMDYSSKFFPRCEWVFHYQGKQTVSWKRAWDSTCRRAGLVEPQLNADGTPKLGKNGKPIMRHLINFHDSRRTAITVQGRAGVTEADSQRVTGHRTVEVHRRYDQDQGAATRTRQAINTYLDGQREADPSQEQPPPADQGALMGLTLKDIMDYRKQGLLSDEEFTAAKSKILK